MKKTFLYVVAMGVVMTLSLSSCTKEQKSLGLLYGTWRLDSYLDSDGLPPATTPGFTQERLMTFFRCNGKDNTNCTGTSKTTTTTTILGSTTTSISGGDFQYSVFENSQILIDGNYWEIETIKKKELVVHPVQSPKATYTYSKQ